MTISLPTRKLLWGLSAARCNMPECRVEVFDESTPDVQPSVVGDEAHIIAKEPDGPRGRSRMSLIARDGFDNLILLCKRHHKVVDDHASSYPVSMLKEWKKSHERWISDLLTDDERSALEKLYRNSNLEILLNLINPPTWQMRMSDIFSVGDPSVSPHVLQELYEVANWIRVTRWPRGGSQSTDVMRALADNIDEFSAVFEKRFESRKSRLVFPRFYKEFTQQPGPRYAQEQQYSFERSLVEDLFFEVTRYVNWLSDLIEEDLGLSVQGLHQRASLSIELHGATSYSLIAPEFTNTEKSSKILLPFSKSEFKDARYDRKYYSSYWQKGKAAPVSSII